MANEQFFEEMDIMQNLPEILMPDPEQLHRQVPVATFEEIHIAYLELSAHEETLRNMQDQIDEMARGPPEARDDNLLLTCEVIEDAYNIAYKRYNKLLRRGFRRYYDPFLLPDHRFRAKYRLSKKLARKLIAHLRRYIREQPNSDIPYDLKILIGLRLFASGSYQDDVADNKHHQVYLVMLISKATVCRCFEALVNALSAMAYDFIKFPSTEQERLNLSQGFLATIPIEYVLGLIDCFVVKFLTPSEHDEIFFHHKHGTSMNVQLVVDSRGLVLTIRICAGSNHDQFIYNHSNLKLLMEAIQGERRWKILGDSGYTLTPHLLTPIEHAEPNSPEARYSHDHRVTRSKVERDIGMIGNVFRVIKRERGMRYAPDKVVGIIKASVVLHNYQLLDGEPHQGFRYGEDFFVNLQAENNRRQRRNNYLAGVAERARVIRQYYGDG